jgi:serine/threonine-protein kinase
LEASRFDGVLKRFEAEAKIAAKIDHPNVIRIFGFNREHIELDDRRYDIDYLVMELLSGRTLRNTMDVSGFETDEEIKAWIGKYLFPILDGLQKVHESGIIHRDIKPENFFLKDDIPKLADFGLSLGFDLPSVTGSVADIFGTMHYMSPEQFFNFSLVREKTDVYSVGKILFEMVEGKITDKSRPLKQASLSNPETDFRKALNRIIMEATAEDPKHRISSASELKDRLSQLLYCPGDQVLEATRMPRRKTPALMKLILPAFLAAAVLIAGAVILPKVVDVRLKPAAEKNSQAPTELKASAIKKAGVMPYPDYPMKISDTSDHSVLRLIPPAELQLRDKEIFPAETIAINSFYLSETPVTNQQYVNFLNSVINRVRVEESDVYLDERLVLKLSEKIRGYKPIVFENGRFAVKNPMHSACAVLMVTGYGAEAYAMHYKLRLPSAREWFFVMQTSNTDNGSQERMPLPTPVINYDENEYGLRGINHLAEWGNNHKGEFVILGQAPSEMVEVDFIETKNPVKYYTDTGFRVALDLPN